MTRSLRIRAGIIAIGSTLTLLLAIQPGHSQIGTPGGIRGGGPTMPGAPRPPGTGISGGGFSGISGIGGNPRPGGISGISGGSGFSGIGGSGISGIRGSGITGISGGSGISGIRGSGISGISGGSGFSGIGGGIGGGTITTWHCGRCGRQVASGPIAPARSICPACGTTNVPPGTGGLMPPGAVAPTLPPTLPPMPGPINPGPNNELPGGLAPENRMPQLPNVGEGPRGANPLPPAGVYVPPSNETASSNRSSNMKWVLIAMVIMVLLALGMGAVIYVIVKQKPVKKVRRPRRRFVDDDDY